jgi:hypothetical protein
VPLLGQGDLHVDGIPWWLRFRVSTPVIEERREVAGADLVRRPPQGVERGLAPAATAGDVGAEVD